MADRMIDETDTDAVREGRYAAAVGNDRHPTLLFSCSPEALDLDLFEREFVFHDFHLFTESYSYSLFLRNYKIIVSLK